MIYAPSGAALRWSMRKACRLSERHAYSHMPLRAFYQELYFKLEDHDPVTAPFTMEIVSSILGVYYSRVALE